MANYRTIRELNRYKGIKMFRLHKDGLFYYYAFENDNQITTRSLKELKRKVDERIREVDAMKGYRFVVCLCGGYANGEITVKARNEDDAYEEAMKYVGKKLREALPDLDIEYNVEIVDYE